MKFNSKLILVIISLFILTLGKNVRRTKGCTDKRCSQICVTKIEKGKPCGIGHCFPSGSFCYCQWVKNNKTYNCDNMAFTR